MNWWGRRLGRRKLMVLTAVDRLENTAHGATLDRLRRILDYGRVTTALTVAALNDDGMLHTTKATMRLSDGPVRKYFVTDKGRREIDTLTDRLTG